ncbi:GSTM3 (predicted) [Pycnogonum litorale]
MSSQVKSIRVMLAYAGVDFDEKFYEVGPPPDFDRSTWKKVKYSLGVDFPNLPYYIDGDIKLSQSTAIMRHIARKYNLAGSSEEEFRRIDLLNGVWSDLNGNMTIMFYYDLEGMKPEFMDNLSLVTKQLSDFLGSRPWFAGDKITFIDFRLYELFRTLTKFSPGFNDKFKNLKDFMSRFEALPTIVEYLKSELTINNRNAQYVGAV